MQDAPAASDVTKIIDGLIHRATQLYTLPAVAAKVLQLTNDPQVDAHAVKQCIENDPALTTKVLRVVNSSLFGLRCEVTDLNQALALLGTKPLKLLVLGFSLPGGLFAGVGASTLGWYWRRTLTKAVAAREICETVWRRPGDESFIAALLQDLGMLVLIQELGAPYLDFLEKVRHGGYDLPSMETASMGFDHTALTVALLTHWGLPEVLIDAIRLRPGDDGSHAAGAGGLRSVVELAEQIARLLADDRPEALGRLLAVGQRTHHLSSEQLTSLVDSLEGKVRSLADALSQALPETTDYRELLTVAHARLSEEAADAAGRMLAQQRADTASAGAASLAAEMQSLGQATARFARRPAGLAPHHAAECPPSVRPAAEPPASKATRTPAQAAGCMTGDSQAGLLGHVAKAVAACRQSRSALSLLLLELGSADDLVLTHGLETFHQLRARLEAACRHIDHERTVCLPYNNAGFAVILVGCDRQLAVRLGNQLIEQVSRNACDVEAGRHFAPVICAGAATVGMPPKNFPPKDLMIAADRCLNGSRASGGGVVKSIEIY